MKYQIVVEPEALEDLYKIKTYITDQDSVSKANKFISELKDKIKSLSQMPQRCRKAIILISPILMILSTKDTQ